MGGYSILSESPGLREARGLRLLPLGGVAVSIFFASALSYYQVVLGGTRGTIGFLQGAVAGLHGLVGFVPSFFLALLVLAWSSVLFVSGRIRSPEIRVVGILVFSLTLSILVSLKQGVAPAGGPPSGGAIGQFFGVRLASLFGGSGVPSVLMGVLVLASLVIATDWFFFQYFSGLAAPKALPTPTPAPVAEAATPEAVVAEEPVPAPRKADSIGMPTPILREEREPAPRFADIEEEAEVGPEVDEPEDAVDEAVSVRRFPAPADEDDGLDLDEDEAERLDEALGEADEEDDEEEETDAADAEDEDDGIAAPEFGSGDPAEAAAGEAPGIVAEPEPPDAAPAAPPVAEEPRPRRRSRSRRREEVAAESVPVPVSRPDAESEEPRQDVLFHERAPGASVLDEAVDLVLSNERASVSFLQRKLRIRFAEASALLDQMEQLGVIGAYDEGSQRPILMTLEEWRARPR